MANQAAVAIQNASAHEKVVRYAEELEASLKRIQLLESIKSNLSKFVPRTVQELIEESPQAPLLDKRELDVSVLFADITGYTRLSAEMELERVNELVERYFGAFLDEIMKNGGDVNETAGDGLMVIFKGTDHAHAAALTALAILRRTQEINTELRDRLTPIAMKVGVNSGIASVGATKIEGAAGTRWTYTASGPMTNIAARLAALTEGGAVDVVGGGAGRHTAAPPLPAWAERHAEGRDTERRLARRSRWPCPDGVDRPAQCTATHRTPHASCAIGDGATRRLARRLQAESGRREGHDDGAAGDPPRGIAQRQQAKPHLPPATGAPLCRRIRAG